jgi:thioredoxin 1
MSVAINTTDQSFDHDVLKASGVVLVDFWAPWCGPCKMIAPVLDEVAREKAGAVTIAKVNIDDHPETPSRFGVRSIPTLMLFKNGQMVSTLVGGQHTKSKIIEWIESEN